MLISIVAVDKSQKSLPWLAYLAGHLRGKSTKKNISIRFFPHFIPLSNPLINPADMVLFLPRKKDKKLFWPIKKWLKIHKGNSPIVMLYNDKAPYKDPIFSAYSSIYDLDGILKMTENTTKGLGPINNKTSFRDYADDHSKEFIGCSLPKPAWDLILRGKKTNLLPGYHGKLGGEKTNSFPSYHGKLGGEKTNLFTNYCGKSGNKEIYFSEKIKFMTIIGSWKENNQYFFRYTDEIIQEILWLTKIYGIKKLILMDPVSSFNGKRKKVLLDGAKASKIKAKILC